MAPTWSLGWHLSANFASQQQLKNTVDEHMAAGFPLDVIHLGKNYTSHFSSFSVDSESFSGLREYITELREAN